jgi:hypothetical protein
MRFAHLFVLTAMFFATSIAQAGDCSVQYSMCLTAEANDPTSNGTQACLSQRTACVAALDGTPGVLGVPPAIQQTPPINPRREQREQFRSLARAQGTERQTLWWGQHEERDATNWKEFDCILRAPTSERKENHRGSRYDGKLGEKWTSWY